MKIVNPHIQMNIVHTYKWTQIQIL